jgi:hypothetical protein
MSDREKIVGLMDDALISASLMLMSHSILDQIVSGIWEDEDTIWEIAKRKAQETVEASVAVGEAEGCTKVDALVVCCERYRQQTFAALMRIEFAKAPIIVDEEGGGVTA